MLQIIARISAFLVLAAALHDGAYGQELTLKEVLEEIDRNPSQMTVETHERLEAFRGEDDRQAMLQRLAEAREELAALKVREAEWLAAENDIDAQVDATRDELMEKARAFGHMLGQFRLASARVGKKLDRSLVSWEYAGRSEALKEIASARTLPTYSDLMTLPNTIVQEMEAQSEIKRFEADVIFENANSQIKKTELIRIGVFTAATTRDIAFVGFREVPTKSGKTYELVRYLDQPGEPYRSMLRNLVTAQPAELVRVPIDRLHGTTLQILGKRGGRL